MKTLRKRFRLASWFLLLGSAAASVCYAQFSGNIQGVVSDPSGAVIAGASVQLRNVDTGVEAAATTSASGNYRFSSLEPGNYRIAAQASGFRKIAIDVRLGTSQTQGINITLPLATASQAVNVTSQAPPLHTGDTRLQAMLSSATVRDLPEINRNIYDVLSAAPGVVGTGTRGAGESPGGDYNADGTNWDVPDTPSAIFGGSHGEQAYINGLFPASVFRYPLPARKET